MQPALHCPPHAGVRCLCCCPTRSLLPPSRPPLQRGAFYRAMGLLTVASPCALVMVPLAYVSAIAAIASRWAIACRALNNGAVPVSCLPKTWVKQTHADGVPCQRALRAGRPLRRAAQDGIGPGSRARRLLRQHRRGVASRPPPAVRCPFVSPTTGCRGILVKGGRVLDALAGCTAVAFDKTGTLTTGSLSCTSMRPLGTASAAGNGGSSTAALLGVPPREAAAAKRSALSVAVALSLRSSHPVSDAVVLHGQAAGLDGSSVDVSDFHLVAGGGVQGTVTAGSGSSRGGSSPTQHAAFGSLDFVSGRLSANEVAAVEQLAAGQGGSGVLSVLVLEPAADAAGGVGGNGAAPSRSAGGSSDSARSVWVLSFEDSVRQQSAAAVRALQTVSSSTPGRPCCAGWLDFNTHRWQAAHCPAALPPHAWRARSASQ